MKSYQIALIIVLLVAFWLRLWQLPSLPPGLWYDEAYNALDAVWMVKTGVWQPFVVGNNGREALWHSLLIPAISLIGQTAFAVRLVGSLVGMFSIPVMYRFALALATPFVRNRSEARWFAVAAAGWLAVSWWHLQNSRAGYRPILLPLLLMLTLFFYWQAWQSVFRQEKGWVRAATLSGLFLGLSQYTYLPARLLPLIIGGLAVVWSVTILRQLSNAERRNRLVEWWLANAIVLAISVLVFLPLGIFFWQNPEVLSARTADVAFLPDKPGEAVVHLLEGVSLFFGAGHELYRHHLPGGERAMLGWLEIPLFWIGLVILLFPRRLKQPETQLILLGFFVMWLPALLASPPVHSLRPIGLLPFYYLIVTVGMAQAARWLHQLTGAIRRRPEAFRSRELLVATTVVLLVSGVVNAYSYFWQWASHPEVYKEYNGPLADLINEIQDLTYTENVVIPFHVYVHPTTRYLLGETFKEVTTTPPIRPTRILLVPDTFQLLYVGNISPSPALVLLSRNESGMGQVFVSRPPRVDEQSGLNSLMAAGYTQAQPFIDQLGRIVAEWVPIEFSALSDLFAETTPQRTVHVNWDNQAELVGYDVEPVIFELDQPVMINFYWHSLTDKTFQQRLFLQLVDSRGEPINQWEGDAFSEDMYRWRPDGLLTSRHTLWMGPETPPGPYLVRMGFFDENTGVRLPIVMLNGNPPSQLLDQVTLGLFYVSFDGNDPRLPEKTLNANFADTLLLNGVTVSGQVSRGPLPVWLHWQALRPTDKPMTIFLQLLNDTGEVISGWDSQPFNGLYPTNLWSPGELVVDTFFLPLPEGGLTPGQYRLVTGFYDFETGQRLLLVDDGDFAVIDTFEVLP